MGQTVCIHINPAMPHQLQHGELLRSAFALHGMGCSVAHTPDGEADIHVVSGPHFARSRWVGHPRVIWLDRCFYRGDPDHVSLAWMKPDGSRAWSHGCGREPPEVAPLKTGKRSIFLADYGGPVEHADTIRLHPAQEAPEMPLCDALASHDIAIGYNSTALVTAAIAGLTVVCKSPAHIMSSPDWRDLLPYADWGLHEFDAAIEHLLCHGL